MYLFVSAFLGNFFYVLSIVTSPQAYLPPPASTDFFRESLPCVVPPLSRLLPLITLFIIRAVIYLAAVGPLFSISPSCPSFSSTKVDTHEGVSFVVVETRLYGARHLRKRRRGYCEEIRLQRRELIQTGSTETVVLCHVRRAGVEASRFSVCR